MKKQVKWKKIVGVETMYIKIFQQSGLIMNQTNRRNVRFVPLFAPVLLKRVVCHVGLW